MFHMGEDPAGTPRGFPPAERPQVLAVEPGEVGLQRLPLLVESAGEASYSPRDVPVMNAASSSTSF